jgi:hypothetical protein
MTQKNSGRVLHNKHILANTKNIQAYRQLIWNVGSQNNVLTTGAPIHHDFIS